MPPRSGSALRPAGLVLNLCYVVAGRRLVAGGDRECAFIIGLGKAAEIMKGKLDWMAMRRFVGVVPGSRSADQRSRGLDPERLPGASGGQYHSRSFENCEAAGLLILLTRQGRGNAGSACMTVNSSPATSRRPWVSLMNKPE